MNTNLTGKRLINKRFRATEDSIIMAYFLTKDKLSSGRLTKIACISRSTLYRHHQNINQIIPHYEEYILNQIRATLLSLMKNKHARLKTLYGRILIFMVANQKIMLFLSEFGNSNLTEKIVLILTPKLISNPNFNNAEILMIYIKEVSSLIEAWQKDGFYKHQITPTLNKIMYLTDTARTRLGPLATFDVPPDDRSA